MEGSWHIYRVGTPWRSPAFQARVVLGNRERQAVGFRLGRVEVIPRREEDTVVGHLGPDLLGPDWSADEAARRLRSHAQTPIGEALLDQRNLAGVGNMYKCEVCFLMGVHPDLPVGEIDCLPQLVTRVQQLLDANKARADQSTLGTCAAAVSSGSTVEADGPAVAVAPRSGTRRCRHMPTGSGDSRRAIRLIRTVRGRASGALDASHAGQRDVDHDSPRGRRGPSTQAATLVTSVCSRRRPASDREVSADVAASHGRALRSPLP